MAPRAARTLRTNGEAIRAIREARGWTVGKFATACRISSSYLSNIEAGRKEASAEVLRRFADVLGVPLAAITSPYWVDEQAAS